MFREDEDDNILENTPKKSASTMEAPASFVWLDNYFKGDKYIWGIIVALYLIGILVVYSATGTLAYQLQGGDMEYYLFKHSFNVALSFLMVWICHRVDYRYYSRLARIALLISVPLLILTWYFGVTINYAGRWITIPIIGQTFQPSDFAKLALIASIASILSRRQRNVDDFQETILPIFIWTGVICALIGLSDISSAVLLFLNSLILMFIGRIPIMQLLLFVMVGFVSTGFSLLAGQRLPTVKNRIEKFLNKEEVFQAEQSYIAISTGGFVGKGPGNSVQRNFLPNPYSDFIYAILIEEYGLLGGLGVIGLYILLLYRGVVVVASTSRPFGGILSAGLTFSLVIQAFVNMAVAVGLVPITGLQLPLLSMGGTSLLFTGIALGIILSVSRGDIDKDLNPKKTENISRR